MKFINRDHEKFYKEMMHQSKSKDVYHQSFFYTVGICQDTRKHWNDLFDFKEDCIKFEALHKGWQTSGSIAATTLAFHLWNGWNDPDHEYDADITPCGLFANGFAPYFFEAIKLRYPEYCKENKHQVISKSTDHEQRY